MEKLDKHIEELLHNHDCVIVPSFGGFITSKMPAFYNKFTSVFHPAKKRILFNKHLVFNDGLLATQVAEKKAMSVEEANQLLIQFKDDCFLRLNEEGRVEIEKVGVLFFDKEKNIQFQQSSTNFLKESFGLSPLSLDRIAKDIVKPVAKPVTIARKEEVKTDRKAIAIAKPEKKASKARKKRGAILLPLILVPVILGGLFIGNQQGVIGNNKINLASFNPFYSANVEEYNPRSGDAFFIQNSSINEVNAGENTVSIVTEKEPVIAENKLEEIVTESVQIIPEKVDSTFNVVKEIPQELKYHVIAGCFSVKENADNLVQTWTEKGNQASVVDKKGKLYRVAIESFATRKEAKSFMKETKKTYSNSLWVLKK
ncbi:MAG: SPOR domain-containing protein [Flavobacteriales bacterium]